MSSSSPSEDSNGIGGGGARRRRAGGDNEGPSSSRRRASRRRGGGDYEGPSSSRRRAANEVWPEPFLEALATQVAIDTARSAGRLAAAAALANVFQVCSTWRAVSRSDLLWHRLTRLIWRRTHLLHATWRHEFMYRHRTALNFRTGRCSYYTPHFDPSDVEGPDGLMCRCLTLSDIHLACGFADGAVRLFDLATRLHVATFRPQYGNRLGLSVAVSGIIITDNTRLVFATLDGVIHVVDDINDPAQQQQPRRVHLGELVNDGVLIDFSGCRRYWVGLYAGLAGPAFRIWNGQTETLTFVGGSLTEQYAVIGWRMLTDLNEFVGRVRVSEGQNSAVACTATRIIDNTRVNGQVMVLDLSNGEVRLSEQPRRGIVARSVDVSREAYVIVDNRGRAIVRRVDTLEEVCRFNTMFVESGGGGMIGCMNLMYWLMCAEGAIRVWEVEGGIYMNMFRERLVEEVNAFVADDRHVAASSGSTLHLWDFGGGDVEVEEEEEEEA
ncbi:hypothetical protein LWI28_011811 [Acer negundo]|uniref:Transcriptional regulator STERILE APETALA n=1 Tax=Acer negundo TaxID=4023 RepID=A0AAD5NS73_ACENE|nr:hypothetical protein LWI28_011811 [Acer negundo]